MDRSRIDPITQRPRAIPIRVWYPAARRAPGPSPSYLAPQVEAAWEGILELPPGTITADTHAIRHAPARRDPSGRVAFRGVILLLPGYLSQGSYQTNQAVDLASRGYVVVTTDHPESSYAVQQPGGALVVSQPANIDDELLGFSERLRDVRLVLNRLDRVVPGRSAKGPKGILGHSMGGAVAAASVSRFRPLLAGMDYDGSPLGDVIALGLSRPFGFLLSSSHPPDPFLDTFLSAMRAPHPLVVMDVQHWGFTDWAVFNPQVFAMNPQLGQQVEEVLPTGLLTSLPTGEAAVARERKIIARFLRRYVERRARRR